MPDNEHHEFDLESIRKIARAVRRLRAQYFNLEQLVLGLRRENPAHEIRTGITTTNSNFPSYPTTGCQFVVQFEDWTFEETTASCADLDTREWAKKFVIARVYGGEYLEEDTRVIIVRVSGKEGRRWWILPVPDKLYRVEALTCFYPGDEDATFKLLKWDQASETWVDSGRTVQVSDPDFQNCLLPEERATVRRLLKADGSEIYHFIGSQGLNRLGKADSEITCDGSGSVTIWKTPSDEACSKEASACQVTACNDWGWTRRIKAGEELRVVFHEKRWTIHTHMRNQVIECQLSADLCVSDASASITGPYKYYDACDLLNEMPSSATNVGAAGKYGDRVLIHYNQEDDEWTVQWVAHHEYDVAVEDDGDDTFIRYDDCAIDGYVLTKAALMYCGEESWVQQISMYRREFTKEVSGSSGSTDSQGNVTCPAVGATKTEICVFDPDDAQASQPVLGFQTVDVLVDHQYADGCYQLIPQVLCVAYVGPEGDAEDFFCTVDCEDESGSGSGQ